MKLDYGTATSPVQPGYTQVTPATKLTTKLGYGWKSGTIYAADAGTGSNLDRDCNYTKNGTFVVTAPNGTYQVSMHLGRAGYTAMDMLVYLDGTKYTVNTSAGQVVTENYTVTVSNKQLVLQIEGATTKLPWAAIDAMTVLQLPSQSAAPATVSVPPAAALAFASSPAAVAQPARR